MGGTNEHQKTSMLHLGVLKQMEITMEGVGNVTEDEICFHVCLSLSCSLSVSQVQIRETFLVFLEVWWRSCLHSSLFPKNNMLATSDRRDNFK